MLNLKSSFFIVIFECLLCSPLYPHYKKNPQGYLVFFKPGKKWNHKIAYKNQQGIGEHIFYLRGLYHKGKVRLGANSSETKFGVYIMTGDSLKDIRKNLNADPGVKSQLIDYSVDEITITMINRGTDHKH